MTLPVLAACRPSNRAAAALLGVTEGAVRYRCNTAGRPDGRANKVHHAAAWSAAVDVWVRQQPGGDRLVGTYRPVNVRALFD